MCDFKLGPKVSLSDNVLFFSLDSYESPKATRSYPPLVCNESGAFCADSQQKEALMIRV